MKNGLTKWVAGTLAVVGMCSFLAAEPPPPPAGEDGQAMPPPPQALKCPKCGCDVTPGMRAPGQGQRDGRPDMRFQQQGMRHGMKMHRLPFNMKDLSEAELAKFLTLNKNVRLALDAYNKEKNDANRAALTKAVGELFDFVQAQKVKTLEKKLAAAKAETGKKDELVKARVDQLIQRAARRQQQQRGPEGRRPEGRGQEGRGPRRAPQEL